MKKRLILGDPHGRWNPIEQIYNKELPDEVIILGDYFDSFDIDSYAQVECYENILNLREKHLRKYNEGFYMLIGNHDMHYIDESFGRCSGWNYLTSSRAGYLLCRDLDKEILQICFIDEVNKTIYSHAGVSMPWFNDWIKSKSLSYINTIEFKAFQFTCKNGGDYYGSSVYNSPLWIRPEGLRDHEYTEWNGNNGIVWSQVFGHTEPCAPYHWNNCGADFYGIDCIARAYLVEYLDDNNKLINRKIIYT